MLKRIPLVVIGLVAAGALTGCGSVTYTPPAKAAAASTPTAVVEDMPVTGADKDTLFIAGVRPMVTTLDAVPDADLIGIAKATCGALDNGATVDQIVAALVAQDVSTAMGLDFAKVTGAGVAVYCPQYSALFTG